MDESPVMYGRRLDKRESWITTFTLESHNTLAREIESMTRLIEIENSLDEIVFVGEIETRETFRQSKVRPLGGANLKIH